MHFRTSSRKSESLPRLSPVKRKRSEKPGTEYISYVPGEFRGETDQEKIVEMLVGKSMFVRKSEQTVNVAVVIPIILGIVAIPYLYTKVLSWSYSVSTSRSEKAQLSVKTMVPDMNSQAGIFPIYLTQTAILPQPTQVIKVQVQVNYPTSMPTPSATADLAQVFYYSYYNPDVIAPGDLLPNGDCATPEKNWCHTTNCWDYDVKAGKCVSPTASGQAFRDWWNKGVACGQKYPLWTVFVVVDPPALAGRWTCIDRGGTIDQSRLDFLQPAQSVNWGSEVRAIVEYPTK
jgi:hypothetical protein